MKRLTLLAVYFAGIAAILGSASAPPQWHKKGVSPMDTDSALSQCEYQIGINRENISAAEQHDLINSCMKGQGYRLKR